MRVAIIIMALVALTAAPAFSEETPSVMSDCSSCHVSHMGSMLLKEPLSELCIGCHPDRVEADHKVDVVPSMDVGGLPLDQDGRMTCATCHDPHDKSSVGAMLRDEPDKLCVRCHEK